MVTVAELVIALDLIGAKLNHEGVRLPRAACTPKLRQDVIKHEQVLQLLYRLRMGQRWLTEQQERFLDDDETAASDELFSRGMDTWHGLQQQLRSKGIPFTTQ